MVFKEGGENIMSPRVKVENPAGKVLFRAEFPDHFGAKLDDLRDPDGEKVEGSLVVRRNEDGEKVVGFKSPLLDSAFDMATGKQLNGKGLEVRLTQEANLASVFTRGDEVRFLNITVEPLGRRGGVERG